MTKGYIDVVKDMQEGAATTITSLVGETSEFPITIGLHARFEPLTLCLGYGLTD